MLQKAVCNITCGGGADKKNERTWRDSRRGIYREERSKTRRGVGVTEEANQHTRGEELSESNNVDLITRSDTHTE